MGSAPISDEAPPRYERVDVRLEGKKEKSTLVLLLGPGELDQLVSAKDRSATLKEMHRRAVIGATIPDDGG